MPARIVLRRGAGETDGHLCPPGRMI